MNKKVERLKVLWNKYEKTWNAKSEYESFIKKYPKEAILNLTLEEYTNIKTNEKVEYFTNWVEIKTGNCGKFRTGSSFAYGIYKVNPNRIKDKKDKDIYKAHDKYHKINKEYLSKDEAEEYFKENIKPLIEKLVNYENLENIKPFDINYARKVAYMYNIDKLIPIYKKEVLESIAEFFDVEAEDKKELDFSSYKVSEIILTVIKKAFDLDEKIDIKLSQKLASFLWNNFGKSVSFDSKNIIYYGAPGTGKTYTVQNAVRQKVLQNRDNLDEVAIFTQFHPSFGYEDFIEGLKPHIKDGATELKLTNGIFKKFCKKAIDNLYESRTQNKEPKPYYFVADEINRAELSTVFGELLLCLEEDKRIDFNKDGSLTNDSITINTQYSYLYSNDIDKIIPNSDKFGVPINLYFIGTMNDIDRSIDSFDLALRRRFIWERMDCNYEVIKNIFFEKSNIDEYITICKDLNNYISTTLELGKSYEIGHSYFMNISVKTKTITKKAIEDLFEKKLKPLLKEYLRAECSENEIEEHIKKAEINFRLSKEVN